VRGGDATAPDDPAGTHRRDAASILRRLGCRWKWRRWRAPNGLPALDELERLAHAADDAARLRIVLGWVRERVPLPPELRESVDLVLLRRRR
jgi:hypothetical protein